MHVAALVELRQGLSDGDRSTPLPRAVDDLNGLKSVASRRLPADHNDARSPHLIREVVSLLSELADHLQRLVVDLDSVLCPFTLMECRYFLDLLDSTEAERYVARLLFRIGHRLVTHPRVQAFLRL